MDVPINPDAISDKRPERGLPRDSAGSGLQPSQPAPALTVESQLKLRSLYEFVDAGQETLKEIRADLCVFESNPDDVVRHKRASERLGQFCGEVDTWGFGNLYKIALASQRLLLASHDRARGRPYWQALFRGLEMLSALLEQCESDFHWGLAIDDMLDCLDPAGLC